MSELGDFLEIVYGPDSQFETVRGTIRQWCNREIAESATGGGRTAIGRRKASMQADDPTLAIDEANLSIWIKLPDRYRIEKDERFKGRTERSLNIVDGKQEWSVNQQGHVETGKPTGQLDTDIARHFEHASLRECFVGLALRPMGPIETAGRRCIRLRAVPRPGGRLWPHWLPCGADEYEFHADTERGVLLYIDGRHQDEVFEVNEVRDVVFDEPIGDDLFSYTPHPSDQVRTAAPIVERMTLEAAVARMPFTVLVPSCVPDAEHNDFEVMYHPPRPQSARAHLALMYRGDHRLWINESDCAEPETAEMEWEQIERDGKRMAISDPGVDAGMSILALEQAGTYVTIMSDLDRDRLIRVAFSLVAAS